MIVSVGGKRVTDPDDVSAAIQDRHPGEPSRSRSARRRQRDAERDPGRAPGERHAMTFQSPWLLLGLVLLPLLSSRPTWRRSGAGGAAAAAFAAPATSASVVPRRPGWRRHAPLALAALAIAALIGALARPQVSVAVPAEQATIVLAMDHSGSMAATDVAPSRLTAALDAGEAFLDKVPKRVRVGGVVFDNVAEAVQSPTTDRDELREALKDAMKPSGGTATGDALATSLRDGPHRGQEGAGSDRSALRRQGHPRPDPLPVADEAKKLGIPIYTVALGTAVGHAAQRRRRPAGHGDAGADRAALGRRGLHRRAVRRAQRGLREARLRGRDEEGAARGHRGFRGRRRPAPAARRRPLSSLVSSTPLRLLSETDA